MADVSSLPFPYLDPAQTPAWIDAQRKQQMAQMLMGAFQQSNQTPADWNSMRQVPKRGALQNVSALAEALMAGHAQKGAMDSQQQYMQGLYGGGQPQQQGPAPTGPGAGIISPDAPPDAQDAANAVSQQPPAPKPGLLPQQPPPNPMIPAGMGRGTANALIGMLGPQEYAKTIVAPQYAPLEIQRQLTAAGIDPNSPQGRAIIGRTLQKGAYIAPIEQREGSVERDPITNAVIGQNPKTPVGGVNFYDPTGNLTGAGLVPGATNMISQSSGADTAGKVANTPAVIPTAGGGSTYGYPGDILGRAPPALRTPSAPVAPGAAPSTPAPPPGIAAPAAAKPTDPWVSIPKLQVSKAIGAPDDFTKGVLQAAGTKHAELSTKYGEEANLADQKLQYNAESRKALPTAEVGPMSEWLTNNRSRLIEMGIPEKLIPGDGSVTPTLELNKNLKNAALQGAKQTFGARMTQNEVMLQHEELSPSTSMTRDAIASLMAQDDIKQQYAKQRAEDYGKYVQQGGDPLRFESWYSKSFPLTQFAQAHSPAPAAPPARGANTIHASADLEAEMRRRGLLK